MQKAIVDFLTDIIIEQEMKQAVSAHVKYGMMGRHNHLKDINIDFFSYKR